MAEMHTLPRSMNNKRIGFPSSRPPGQAVSLAGRLVDTSYGVFFT